MAETVIALIKFATFVAGTVQTVKAQKSAAIREKELTKEAQRTREAQAKKSKALLAQVEAPIVKAEPAKIQQEAEAKASVAVKKRRLRRTKTILTGPRGALEEPTVGKKALLGE